MAKGTPISMDGKGRWVDNAFIERLWRSLKDEEICLHACDIPSEANTALERYFRFYNARRLHQGLGDLPPDEVSYGPK